MRKKTGFTIVPNKLILDNELSAGAKMLYIYIRSLSDNYRSLRNATLMKNLDISKNTLRLIKKELINKGYLKLYRQKSANYYKLLQGKTNVL